MSFRLRWQLALRDSDTDAAAKHVGLTLGTHMDAHGRRCYPGKTLLAAETSLGVRTVDRSIARLAGAGWIVVEQSSGYRSNRYRATIPNRVKPTGITPSQRRGQSPSHTTTNPVTDDNEPRHSDGRVRQEPVKELVTTWLEGARP